MSTKIIRLEFVKTIIIGKGKIGLEFIFLESFLIFFIKIVSKFL